MAGSAIRRNGVRIYHNGLCAAYQGTYQYAYTGAVCRQAAASSARTLLVSAHADCVLRGILCGKPAETEDKHSVASGYAWRKLLAALRRAARHGNGERGIFSGRSSRETERSQVQLVFPSVSAGRHTSHFVMRKPRRPAQIHPERSHRDLSRNLPRARRLHPDARPGERHKPFHWRKHAVGTAVLTHVHHSHQAARAIVRIRPYRTAVLLSGRHNHDIRQSRRGTAHGYGTCVAMVLRQEKTAVHGH